MEGDISDVLTNESRPKADSTITVRVIKSFEYRTHRSLVLHHLNLESTTAAELKKTVLQTVHTQSGWKPYRNVTLDTLKLYTRAHGAKTTNLIVNLDNDDWIIQDEDKTLADLGFENETEVSLFNRDAYEKFKLNPETKWDT